MHNYMSIPLLPKLKGAMESYFKLHPVPVHCEQASGTSRMIHYTDVHKDQSLRSEPALLEVVLTGRSGNLRLNLSLVCGGFDALRSAIAIARLLRQETTTISSQERTTNKAKNIKLTTKCILSVKLLLSQFQSKKNSKRYGTHWRAYLPMT